jgi:hypothetical protein
MPESFTNLWMIFPPPTSQYACFSSTSPLSSAIPYSMATDARKLPANSAKATGSLLALPSHKNHIGRSRIAQSNSMRTYSREGRALRTRFKYQIIKNPSFHLNLLAALRKWRKLLSRAEPQPPMRKLYKRVNGYKYSLACLMAVSETWSRAGGYSGTVGSARNIGRSRSGRHLSGQEDNAKQKPGIGQKVWNERS